MKLVVFGLSVSSSWANGHATLWRGLIHALAARGHSVTFYERDTPYYAAHRDCFGLPNGELQLYRDFAEVCDHAALALRNADVGMVTSYCPDALAATRLLLDRAAPSVRAFYDLDTPITLHRLARGETVEYIGPDGLRAPVDGVDRYRSDLSYLGTYAAERQAALEELFLAPAQASPQRRFALGGSQYPADFRWAPNIDYLRHVPPAEHAAFYCSARLNLNVTRAPMAALGYCPSGRMFEAAACGAALISDVWPGLEEFYVPDQELLVARDRADVMAALELSDAELKSIGQRARERTLAQHSMEQRATQLIQILEDAQAPLREFEREARTLEV
jgi:spore maturation protein CgeB